MADPAEVEEGEESDPLLDPLLAAAFATAPQERASAEAADFGARYQVEGELGRGGVGVVLRGRDRELGRDVALKVLRPEHVSNASLERRFVEEAQIAGQLEHPGIVPVYEMGRTGDRRPFFAMRLVQGRTFASLLAARATPMEEQQSLLAIFEQICQTVAFAHARGVVHRDLKPANVLVGAFGEVQVADWGLAKVLGRSEAAAAAKPAAPAASVAATASTAAAADAARESAHVPRAISTARSSTSELLSQFGSVLGTLAYMPPEQARGEHDKLDARADVFALGAMLCELLTGRPPYVGEIGEVLEAARAANLGPALACLRESGADADLIAVATRCLAAERDQRPRDAGEVAAAVAHHRTTLVERARAAELTANAARARAAEERRARRLTLALAGTLVFFIGCATFGWLKCERDERMRQETAAKPVRAGMMKARDLAAAARQVPANDPAAALAQWQAGLAEIARAESARDAADPGPAVAAELATLATELRAGAREAADRKVSKERDDAMVIRIGQTLGMWGVRTWAECDREFAAAFGEYGIDLATMTDDEILARMRASTIAVDLADGLFAWLRTKNELKNEALGRRAMHPKEFDRLFDLVKAADPDPWLVRIRECIPKNSAADLVVIAADPAAASFNARTTTFLGFLLDAFRERDQAVALFRRARDRFPTEYIYTFQLGDWLQQQEPVPWEEVSACYGAGVALYPGSALAWYGLGIARDAVCNYDGALVAFEHALAADPGFRSPHTSRALTLLRSGRAPEAATALRAAIGTGSMTVPEAGALAHALLELGDAPQAAQLLGDFARDSKSDFERVALLPRLRECGELDVVEEQARRVLEGGSKKATDRLSSLLPDRGLQPEQAELLSSAEAEIGRVLLAAGRVQEALEAMRRAQAIVSRPQVAQEMATAERLVEAHSHLDDLLSGAWLPDEPGVPLAGAWMCALVRHHTFAVGLFETALATDLEGSDPLSADAREQAARSALLAAGGHGEDSASLDPPTRVRLRARARAWLAEELDARVKDAPLRPRGELREMLERWRRDPVFAAVRGAASLAALPNDEAQPWRSFWTEVQAALGHAPAR